MASGTIALVGNPNSGKTTFFNALTGSNQHVGNWPGVTVEKKEGSFKFEGEKYHVVDLPGTYSLGAFSEDEVVARNFILTGNPDVIIDVVDASNIERNLYLTTQLLEMGKKVVIALNMVDEAEKRNIDFDIDGLSKKLGIPVIPTIATKGKGIKDIVKAAIDLMNRNMAAENPVQYGETIEHHIRNIERLLAGKELPYPTRWTALKIIEGDQEILNNIKQSPHLDQNLTDYIEKFHQDHRNEDLELEIIDAKYSFANKAVDGTIKRPAEETVTITDKIDRIFTNKYLGIPIFAGIMLIVFQLTFVLGEEILGGLAADLIDGLGGLLAMFLVYLGAPGLFTSFMIDGVINGVGAVVEFVPLILVLYLLLSFLEDSGYMARAAYVWDDLMRRLGLQGKAFISLIIGFGCNVPGIMSARTLDNKKDRMITTLITPFMSCGAKLPIYSIFIAAFFSRHGGLILFSLYAFGILVGLIMAKIFSKTLFKGESSYFIMELPPYRIPTLRNVLRNMWDNVYGFLKRAGTVIFVVITLLWVLAVLPVSVEPYSQLSILGRIGAFIAPIFAPAGFGSWQESVALFAGIPAKEAVVGTLGMLYAGQYVEQGAILVNAVKLQFTSLTALSYMVMTLLYTPCIATLSVVGKETNSLKWPLFMALYTFALGWLAAVAIFQVGSLLGFS
ncbi:MAG: ferrous iron transport protein B [Peptococcaceae bacterium]|nr:ferrous iron transport protein B [Candidatus Syntrophopropionicum ammoniitolerans]